VIEARLEDLDLTPFDGAVAQAVWPPGEWIPRALRLVRPGGAIYVLGSAPLDAEDLPAGARFEARMSFARPRDGAPRHASRIVPAEGA
jgi:hypothetical protein